MFRACLRLGAAAAVMAGLSILPNGAGATTPTPPPYPVNSPYMVNGGTLTPIKHLIVVFQENVSYDHYFGTYPNAANPAGEPAFHALPGTPASNNYVSNPALLSSNPNTTAPFRLDRSEAVTCDQDHNYNDEQKMFDGNANGTQAKMDQFVQVSTPYNPSGCAHGPSEVMGYFDGNTVTGMWNLAQHFSMSDNSWDTTFGPSTPGAMNLVAGQTHGVAATNISGGGSSGTCTTDPAASHTCSLSGNASNGTVIGDPDPLGDDCANATRTQVQMGSSAGSGSGPLTIGDVLSAKNISWGWFQGGFDPTSVTSSGAAVCGSTHKNLAGNVVSDYNPHHEGFQYFPTTENPHHISPSTPDQIGQNDNQGINHQYDEADFYTALQNNNLPAVTFLKGANYQDGHAGTTESDPLEEQTFLADVIDSVEQSPSWSNTAIVIAYDDSDGWYDHAFQSPVNPSSDPSQDFLNSGTSSSGSACGTPSSSAFPLAGYQDRCGPGPRLPLMVISPWARQNYIDHSFTDQSSMIKFIEENWGTSGLGGGAFESLSGLNSQGSQGSIGSGDLMNLFDFNQSDPRAPAVILDDQTGAVNQVIPPGGQSGPAGPAGPAGASGQNGAPGTTKTLAAPLLVPRVLCLAARKSTHVKVTCVEAGATAGSHRATVRLMRGSRVLARGSGPLAGITLRPKKKLKKGTYMLKVTVSGAAPDSQVVRL